MFKSFSVSLLYLVSLSVDQSGQELKFSAFSVGRFMKLDLGLRAARAHARARRHTRHAIVLRHKSQATVIMEAD